MVQIPQYILNDAIEKEQGSLCNIIVTQVIVHLTLMYLKFFILKQGISRGVPGCLHRKGMINSKTIWL